LEYFPAGSIDFLCIQMPAFLALLIMLSNLLKKLLLLSCAAFLNLKNKIGGTNNVSDF
jgi:hypothetical protein